MVLVLNGHNTKKVATAKEWLDLLPSMPNLKGVGLIVLGNELCTNDNWLMPYLTQPDSYKIRFVFLVYGPAGHSESPVPIFHWPLGVATYRDFPNVPFTMAVTGPNFKKRDHLCNFIGTAYKDGADRQHIVKVLEGKGNALWNCVLQVRTEWQEKEEETTKALYHETLQASDYTLCPAGYNVEAYRFDQIRIVINHNHWHGIARAYEAMSYGSVPIIKRDASIAEGTLQDHKYLCRYSYQLLKENDAPVIWIDDWSEIGHVLDTLHAESGAATFQRR